MLASMATLAAAAGAYRAARRRWDWAVFGVLATFVYLYAVVVTCVVRHPGGGSDVVPAAASHARRPHVV
jgi:hypothetical protein